jgi:hypothetical protein
MSTTETVDTDPTTQPAPAVEEDDIVPSMHAPPTVNRAGGRTKGFSDISGMIMRDAPYNARMMPFATSGLDKLSEKDQQLLTDEILNAATKSGRKKTKSDIAQMMAVGFLGEAKAAGSGRKRQISNADQITKFGYAPQLGYDDLNMAEAIVAHGTARERQGSHVSDMVIQEEMDKLEGKEEDGFVYNHVGLTTAEAEKLLAEWGKNELPEKVSSTLHGMQLSS